MKNIFYIIIIITFISSCYQAPESSSGSVAVRLNSDLMRDAPGDFDGELRLAVFDEGDLDSLIDYPVGAYPMIAYLGDFPTPLLANNSVPFYGSSGVLSMLNVPSDKPLKLLIEHDGTRFDEGSTYFHSFSGVSETFEVEGGGTAEVAITLTPTADGSITVNNDEGFSTCFFRAYEPDDLDGFINFSGTPPDEYAASLNSEPPLICEGSGTVSGSITFPDAILPGKKVKILISQNSTINYDTIGISEAFEVQPGSSKSVTATYYSSCIYFC